MLVKSNVKTEFSYKREEGQNPYTGVMSFQHFRRGLMYSDIVVRPEANYCETERVECPSTIGSKCLASTIVYCFS